MSRDIKYYKENAEEDYMYTPISVLSYISELEKIVSSKVDNQQGNVVLPFTSGSTLTWIEKDDIAGKCLNEFLKHEPDTSPLYTISSKLLRQLIIEGIDAGLKELKVYS